MPWVSDPPGEIVRERVRLTIQPFDAPPDAGGIDRLIDQIGSDEMLLFATDYPHWQFDGDSAVPAEGRPGPAAEDDGGKPAADVSLGAARETVP